MPNYDITPRSTATSKSEGRLMESISGMMKKKKKKTSKNSLLTGIIKNTEKKVDGMKGSGSKYNKN